MDFASINAKYWAGIAADDIIGDNAAPGDELLSRLPVDAKLLDVGCGRGRMAGALSAKGYAVTAIDLNEEAIRNGRSRNDGVTYQVADVTDGLPFPDGTFDAVLTSFVLVNIPKTQRAGVVRELHRVLKPGGYAWINEGTASEGYRLRYDLARPYADEDRTFFVMGDKAFASAIATPEDLKSAIGSGGVARMAHHFTADELRELFSDDDCLHAAASVTASPRTKTEIRMITLVFRKPGTS